MQNKCNEILDKINKIYSKKPRHTKYKKILIISKSAKNLTFKEKYDIINYVERE